MVGTTWVYDPHSGGTKIPDRAKDRIRQRFLKHAEAHYAGRYRSTEGDSALAVPVSGRRGDGWVTAQYATFWKAGFNDGASTFGSRYSLQ